MALLEINNVKKVFEKTVAVNNISLHVPQGIIFGLLGPNGAGKTTLIRMITNILYEDSGSISLQGVSDNRQRNMFIGYMPEERGLYKKMKVGEQLMYLAGLKNLSRKEAKENIDYWMEKFAITDWWDKQVGELSKGMQQKIQFIATVVHKPKLIILDEPFSGLDPINTNLIKEQIFELKQEGATILFSTHRMEQVEQICEDIALINKGEIILEGSVNELRNRFKEHKFRIQYSGGLLPSFQDAPFDLLHNEAQEATIRLHDGYNTNSALQYLIMSGIEISLFKEILPSINEIFITQVQADVKHTASV